MCMHILVKGSTFQDFSQTSLNWDCHGNALLADTGCKPLEILEEGQHFIILPHVFAHSVMLSRAVPEQWNAKGLSKMPMMIHLFNQSTASAVHAATFPAKKCGETSTTRPSWVPAYSYWQTASTIKFQYWVTLVNWSDWLQLLPPSLQAVWDFTILSLVCMNRCVLLDSRKTTFL